MAPSPEGPMVKTRILIISDTHAMDLLGKMPQDPVDLVIHCGDLTEESKLAEFNTTLELLDSISAPLKLVIAGNHDFTLDTPIYEAKIKESTRIGNINREEITEVYGNPDEARSLLIDARAKGIHFLEEGTRRFTLPNGAQMTLYASPFTPSSRPSEDLTWGFQYHRATGHTFDMKPGTDIVVTHGPPEGIMDRTVHRTRAGCKDLFAAVARTRPRLHCFGHIHEGWGAKIVAWRDRTSETPSHMVDIDNGKSEVVESLTTIDKGVRDKVRRFKEQGCCVASLCTGDERQLKSGKQTLFVNASIKGSAESETHAHFPWVVELELPRASSSPAEGQLGGYGEWHNQMTDTAVDRKRSLDVGGSDMALQPKDESHPAKRRRPDGDASAR